MHFANFITQKRKPEDSDGQPATKKIKSEAKAPKKEKVIKEKKTPKPKKEKQVFSTPAPSSTGARRSSRGTSARKSYADRDSSDDDQEMMEGVAKWVYGMYGDVRTTQFRQSFNF